MDISKDPRILMAEYALDRLKTLTINKKYKLPASKEKTLEAINKMNSILKNIKYSYIEPKILVDDTRVKEFELMSNQFWDYIVKNNPDIDKPNITNLELRFIFNILKGFRRRLRLGNQVPISKAIDIIAVKIISVSKLPKSDNLFLCRVGDGKRVLNIITNLKGVKKDQILPAAILPPREFGGEISEAMFVSSVDLKNNNLKAGDLILELPDDALKEVNNQILKILKGH